MKRAVIAGIAIMLILTLVPSIGCGSSTSKTVINMMKSMPDSTSEFFVENFKAARAIGADELNENYGGYLDMWEENLLEWGISSDEVDSLAWHASDAAVFLIGGDFNLDNIRGKLEESGEYRDEYRGVEIWTGGESMGAGFEGDLIHALINNKLIAIGFELGIDSCVGVINEGDASIYDNNDFRDIIERLPDGLSVKCSMNYDPKIEDIIIGGFSLVMNDDGTQDFTFVGKFVNSEAASNGIDIIMSDLAGDFNFDLAVAQATQDGVYITITAKEQEIY